MQDWNYLHTNDFEITLEIGCFKYPRHEDLNRYWDDNRDALLAYIEKVHSGIKGAINDEDGNPIGNATIEVDGIRHNIQVRSLPRLHACVNVVSNWNIVTH